MKKELQKNNEYVQPAITVLNINTEGRLLTESSPEDTDTEFEF